MSKFRRKTTSVISGFSLLEVLIYVALLTAISISTIALMLSLHDLIDVYRADQRVMQSAQTALERMLYELRAADAVDTTDPDLTLNTSPGHLVITNASSTVEFSVANDAIVLTVDGASQGQMTHDAVSIDELKFFHYDNSVTEAVRIKMTVSAVVGAASSTATFYGSAVLLGSYE